MMDYGSKGNSSLHCNTSLVPTSEEYLRALGSFGTALLVIGGLITVALYVLFLEQVWYTFRNSHRVFRRHIYWISSVYPFMAMMSVTATVVPRAHNICSAVKVTYMAIGISHFMDLTVIMFGSEEMMVAKTAGKTLNIQLGPMCCCCCCLPEPPVTKFSLRMVMLLLEQLPFTQAAYHLTVLILMSADIITLGNVNPGGIYLWLTLFNLASLMSGVYALQILTDFSKGYLEFYNYTAKSFSMKTLVLATNLQSLVFDIMANYGAFPCIPPYLPPQVYKQTVENTIYLVEMMVLGAHTYWHYHNRKFLNFNPSEVDHMSGFNHPARTSLDTTTSTCSGMRTARTSTRSTSPEHSLSDISSSITSTSINNDNIASTCPVRKTRVHDDIACTIITNSSIPASGATIEHHEPRDSKALGNSEHQEGPVTCEHPPDIVLQRPYGEHQITSLLTVHQPSGEHHTESGRHGEHFHNSSHENDSLTQRNTSRAQTSQLTSTRILLQRRFSC